jgi:hypothetical protein
MLVQDKKTRGIRICVNLRKLNYACLHDPFLTPFIDEVLENVGVQETYSFTDGFSGYHQIKITQEDRHTTTFAIEWGNYQYTMMPFGLKNAPAVFSRVVVATFKDFIHKFLEVYLDDWKIFSILQDHIEVLQLMLDQCKQCHILLKLKKCIFLAPFKILLGHIVCKKGLLVDPTKIIVIMELASLISIRQLRENLGHSSYYKKFIKGYAQNTTPMEKLLKKEVKLQWNEDFHKGMDTLKQRLVTAPILIFPYWDKEFHVHASSIALGIVLSQPGEGAIDHPIVFATRKLYISEKKLYPL